MNTSETILSEQMVDLLEVFAGIIFFLIAYAIKSWRYKKRLELIHKERMTAIEKGVPLLELPDYETSLKSNTWFEVFRNYLVSNPKTLLGFGATSFMTGIGISLAFFLSGDEYHKQLWSFGLIGIFLGLGLFLHYFLTKDRTK